MRERTVIRSLFLIIFLAASHGASAYETLQGRTETLLWDREKAYNGFTLFAANRTTYLIDMEGRLVRTWKGGTNPRFLDNGNLLDMVADESGNVGFREVDWDGNIIWEYFERRPGYHPHHDFVRIFNKKLNAYTTLYIANREVTHEACIASGCGPAKESYAGSFVDAVVEVDMSGNVVWEWWFFEHVVQDIDPSKKNYVGTGKTIANYPGRLNVNLPGRPVGSDWLHCNSLDYHPGLDQIVINSVYGEFYVIDHGATFVPGNPAASVMLAAGSAGDFLYRFGDPARYEQGDPPSILEDWTSSTAGHKQIGASHDVHWIRPGLPGAGNFLVFNNGQFLFELTPQSYVLEVNPYLNSAGKDTGNYVNPPAAGYFTPSQTDTRVSFKQKKNVSNQIVWAYLSKNVRGFFSQIASGAQRLPNGNTLICSSMDGHIFEVTADGTLVWEYINPVTAGGAVQTMPDSYPMTNFTFRAYRYDTSHPALAGRNMTAGRTIAGRGADAVYGSGQCASYDASAGMLHIPCLVLGGTDYWVDLGLQSLSPLLFNLQGYGTGN